MSTQKSQPTTIAARSSASRTLTVAAPSGGSTPTPEGGEESPRTGGDQPPSSGGDGLEPEPIGTPLPSEEAASPAVSGPRKVGSVRPSRRGVVRIPRLRAKCPVGGGLCKLDVRLHAMPPRKRARAVGKRRKPLAAGRSAKVAVRLSRAGRRLLNRHRKVRARATVRLSRPGAPTAVKKTKLKLVRARGRGEPTRGPRAGATPRRRYSDIPPAAASTGTQYAPSE